MARRPPCPDPLRYKWIKTKGGGYWRLKRGELTEATLNKSLAKNASAMSKSSPAASRLRRVLEPWLRGLEIEKVQSKITGLFTKTYNKKGKIDFSLLKGLELQPSLPLNRIYKGVYTVEEVDKQIIIKLPLQEYFVTAQGPLATNYYFEAIEVWGNPQKENGLKAYHEESKLYPFGRNNGKCELAVDLSKGKDPCLVILKLSSLEGNELALHPKNYGMKVVAVENDK